MKLPVLFCFAILSTILVKAQSTTIPDPNFEQALVDLGIDSDGMNGLIINSDAQVVNQLHLANKNISNLEGIAAFTNLTYLDCSQNNLTSLDLSANNLINILDASYNQLTSLNLTGAQFLEALQVQENLLSALDVSSFPNLYFFYCFANNLSSLNVDGLSALTHFSCGENQLTGTLDISNMGNLEFFACRYNQIDSVHTGIHSYLSSFNSQNNQIKHQDLSYCFSLEYVFVDSNQLESLNINNQSNVFIQTFHAEGNPNLYCIQVDDAAYSNANSNWIKDPQTTYAINCLLNLPNELTQQEVSAFPNPANELLHLSGLQSYVGKEVLLTNALGQPVYRVDINADSMSINTSTLEKGIYLIQISSGPTLKVVVE